VAVSSRRQMGSTNFGGLARRAVRPMSPQDSIACRGSTGCAMESERA